MKPKTFIAGQCTETLREIAKVLNLDPDDHPVNSITIESRHHEPMYAIVKLFITVDQDKAIAEVVKRYEMVEVKPS